LGNGKFENSPFPCSVEITFNEIKFNFIQASAGLRSTTFMSDDRKIFWCGTNGEISRQSVPIEFRYKEKVNYLIEFKLNLINIRFLKYFLLRTIK